MAKNVQTGQSTGGETKPPSKKRVRRPRRRAAPPTPSPDLDDGLDDGLEDDLASLREKVLGTSGGKAKNSAPPPPPSSGPQDPMDYLDMLTQAFNNMGSGQWDENEVDNMTSGAALVLGSGPAFAALGSMMAGATAQSAILMNATQTQRQLDQVGLCCTSACVKQLLNMNNGGNSD